ncbi:MAG TPA: DUF4136 domain-containing protein [Terriglobales bacterium]|jgi:hypothetical protein
MKPRWRRFWSCVFVAALTTSASAQKVKVGYDKSVDFSKYKTYTLAEPAMPPTRPTLYAMVISSIDTQLGSKGLERVDKDGDLTLNASGGIDFGIAVSGGTPALSSYGGGPPSMNSTMWAGAGAGELMPAVPDASLHLQFVDRNENRIVWSGTVTQALDTEQKEKSLKLASKAVAKLLKRFPPKSSNSD